MTAMDKSRLDEIARDYHANPEVPDKHIEDLSQHYAGAWILQALGPARRVLEMGYGEGIITRMLAEDGRQLSVVEGSAALHARIRARHGERVEAVHALFEDYTPAMPFDAVVASHILEHVEDPVALLKRVRSWLAHDGRLIIIVPNSQSLHRRLAVIMGLQPELDSLSGRDQLVGHRRVYSLAMLQEHLLAAGFEAVETRGFFLKPLANSMMLDYSPQLLAAMNEVSTQMPAELLANIGVAAIVAASAG